MPILRTLRHLAFGLTLIAAAAALLLFSDRERRSEAGQRAAMPPLAFMDGEWRGTAWTLLPSGEKHTLSQTERIGPFLDGSVKVIEAPRRFKLAGGNHTGTLGRFRSLFAGSRDKA